MFRQWYFSLTPADFVYFDRQPFNEKFQGISMIFIINIIASSCFVAGFVNCFQWQLRKHSNRNSVSARATLFRFLVAAVTAAAIMAVCLFASATIWHSTAEYVHSRTAHKCGSARASTLLRIETANHGSDEWPPQPPTPAAAAAEAIRRRHHNPHPPPPPPPTPPPPVVTQWVAMRREQCERLRCAWTPAGGAPADACSMCTCRPW